MPTLIETITTPWEQTSTSRLDETDSAAPHADGVSPLIPVANALRGPDLPLPERHLMVVEDNALSRKMMNIFLRRKGFYVHSFANSTEALGWSAFAAPSAMLLDVLLPDISGLDLFEQLRSMPHLEKVPVIFVTAFRGERYEQQCLQRGATAFFAKPAYLPAIAACLSRTLNI